MIDVHPPHEPLHGWRDFLIHLFTITVGLLIALSLEGLVEWQHHRHLVHEAEAGLHAEIQSNASGMKDTLASLHKDQADLKHAAEVLKILVAKKKMPNGSFSITYRIHTFDNVSWRTAQDTGALAYMPYDLAKEYSSIYDAQDMLTANERQAAQAAAASIGMLIDTKEGDPDPTPTQAEAMLERVNALQGQLFLIDNFMQGLSQEYGKFLATHPG